MTVQPVPLALTFHAEQLHDDEVWRRTLAAAKFLAGSGRLATFFVYPFRAAVAGHDIRGRVAELHQLGHEIAQHTHFYAGRDISGAGKRNDLSVENVRVCIMRDREVLREAGCEPRGFVAGAWLADAVVLDVLSELDFDYDMSSTVRATSNEPPGSGTAWLDAPTKHSEALLRIPTTSSLRFWWRRQYFVRPPRGIGHEVVYLHDYDLLRRGTTTLLKGAVPFVAAERTVTGLALARRFGHAKD